MLNAESVAYAKNGEVPVLILNSTENEIHGNIGTIVATMYPIEEDSQIIPLGTGYIRKLSAVKTLSERNKAKKNSSKLKKNHNN